LDCTEYVNSDEFAKSLSPFSPESAFITASRYMLKKVQFLFDRREDFCIETTLATRSLLKMVREAQAQGYFVTVLYMWLRSPDMAVARVAARVEAGGHNIPEETIRRRYQVGLNYFFRYYIPACDRWILADNSTPPFQIVAEGSKKGLVVRDMKLYNAIRGSVTDAESIPSNIDAVREQIAQELARVPVARDGVPALIGSHENVENDS